MGFSLMSGAGVDGNSLYQAQKLQITTLVADYKARHGLLVKVQESVSTLTLLTLTFYFALEPWVCVKFNTPLKDQYRLSFFYSKRHRVCI